ncbi:unnamed protein product [Phaeothamnion confervicola]
MARASAWLLLVAISLCADEFSCFFTALFVGYERFQKMCFKSAAATALMRSTAQPTDAYQQFRVASLENPSPGTLGHSKVLVTLPTVTRPLLLAVLRNVPTKDVVSVAEAIVATGFNMISVTADTFGQAQSISLLAQHFAADGRAVIGASTATNAEHVKTAVRSGAQFVSTPRFDVALVSRTVDSGLLSIPAVTAPADAIAALAAGAGILKLYNHGPPSRAVPPATLDAMATQLPADALFMPAGGLEPRQLGAYSGACGFAVGGTLYRPGADLSELASRATAFVAEARKHRAVDSSSLCAAA